MKVDPYLSFEGRCDEAIEFYKTALGAQVNFLLRFKDMPTDGNSPKFPPDQLNKVMHATLRIGDSTVMVTDGRCVGAATFSGITLSLAVSDNQEANQRFNALAEGGRITMPLTKTFFSPGFGMLTDRFGVGWMVNAQA